MPGPNVPGAPGGEGPGLSPPGPGVDTDAPSSTLTVVVKAFGSETIAPGPDGTLSVVAKACGTEVNVKS